MTLAKDWAREHLLPLDLAAFRAVVDLDSRGRASAQQVAGLRSGDVEVTERWYQSLVYAKKNVENQLASKRTEHKGQIIALVAEAEALTAGEAVMDGPRIKEYLPPTDQALAQARVLRQQVANKQTQYHAWRAGALRFRAYIEERLSEAAWGRRAVEKTELLEQRRALQAEVGRANAALDEALHAIRNHRDHLADVDPTDIDDEDRALWALLPAGSNDGEQETWTSAAG